MTGESTTQAGGAVNASGAFGGLVTPKTGAPPVTAVPADAPDPDAGVDAPEGAGSGTAPVAEGPPKAAGAGSGTAPVAEGPPKAGATAGGDAAAVASAMAAVEKAAAMTAADTAAAMAAMAAVEKAAKSSSTGATTPGDATATAAPLRPLRAEVLTDPRGAVVSVDTAFTAILGWAPEEIVGRRIGQLVHPDDLPRGLASWARMLERPGATGSGLRLRYRHRDGGWVWFDVTTRNRLGEPEHHDVSNEMVDVTREVTALDQLRVCEQLLDHVNEAVPVGLFYADRDGRLVYVSRRLAAMTGVPAAVTLGEQLAGVADMDRARLRAAVQGAAGGAETGVELSVNEAQGSPRRWALNLRPMRNASGAVTGVTGCVQDVTVTADGPGDRAKTSTDALTGCLTEDGLLSTLGEMLSRHRPPPANGAPWGNWPEGEVPKAARGTAVLMIDVDGLGTINDRYGQAAGDELLTVVALRIVDAVRSSDVVGRMSGDQFAVLCGGVPGPTTALTIGRSTMEQVCRPVQLKSAGSITVQAHMGVSWTNQADVDPAVLMRQADEAMGLAKGAPSAEPVLAPA